MSDCLEGVLVFDLEGQTLSDREKCLLIHPAVVGVILFSRNFQNRNQLVDLVDEIRSINAGLLIMTDQEGGRVQRFRSDGFTRVPAMGIIGEQWNKDPHQAVYLARDTGWLLASELRASGIDLGLSPILDLDRGISRVIGDRGFSADPEIISKLAAAFISGLHEAGMASVGKHFPGHGGIGVDSHIGLPVDRRSLEDIEEDLMPYRSLVSKGLDAVMPAHVCFSVADEQPAGFSEYWLQNVLREDIGFDGAIFSDCLSMAGARVVGNIVQRSEKALLAGCDAILVCNNPESVDQVVNALEKGAIHFPESPLRRKRLEKMRGASSQSWKELESSTRRVEIINSYQAL
ncbi:beta-N-acetylhexosaminidase [Parendozoicomonas sp. Alg238-R29]|uniref:beta-N-acetylhexosaminidase n=1 Tax=Parendozoicomonas sp. Alg238-R29 TaxID=2993446 RepID=UPI00248E78C5|nr:beta-N-acetylhexosaminidase [Parendozoicomonas sp. Alg238-R29]